MTGAIGTVDPTFPGSLTIEGIICYEKENEPGIWLYLPGAPIPELANGRPTVSLFVSASSGILQLGVQWAVPAPMLNSLRSHIAQRSDTEEDKIQLQPGPASVREVTLEVGDGTGSFSQIATSKSSGFPPFNTVFRLMLDTGKKNAVIASLNGRPQFLAVHYFGSAVSKVSVRTVLEGDVRLASAALNPDSTPDQVAEWIQAAVDSSQLKCTTEGKGIASSRLIEQSESTARKQFARALKDWIARGKSAPPDRSNLKVECTVSEWVEQDFERIADISEWFDLGQGLQCITVLPGGDPILQPSPREVWVGMAFPAVALPIAFVEIRSDTAKALMRPPDFAPLRIMAVGAVMQITTHYSNGQSPYPTRVDVASSGTLHPGSLGLTEIVVDGSARGSEGVKSIHLELRFLPAGGGAPEDRTFDLQLPAMKASFFMVTRGQPVAGEFSLDWTESGGAGESGRRHLGIKDQSVLIL